VTELIAPPIVSAVDDTDGTIGISNSEIQTFKQCKRKWYITYYLKFRPRKSEIVSARALGTRVHKVLEDYYRDGVPLLETHERLVIEDRAILESQGQDGSDLDNDAELGQIML
jgi:CRISPR/Cas system-associated exonuclease Cas4 (RecB family)